VPSHSPVAVKIIDTYDLPETTFSFRSTEALCELQSLISVPVVHLEAHVKDQITPQVSGTRRAGFRIALHVIFLLKRDMPQNIAGGKGRRIDLDPPPLHRVGVGSSLPLALRAF